MQIHRIETSHATIAVSDTGGSDPVVLMIHGNSSCRGVFRNQLEGAIGQDFRCIAFDLPGHGESSDAIDPERTYWMPGYADTGIELMQALDIPAYAVLGWSLGGHIGLEMMARGAPLTGLMISGTPPIAPNTASLDAGFKPSEHMGLAGQEVFSEQDVSDYAHSTCGANAPFEPFLLEAVARTDGRARRLMFERILAPEAADQQAIAVKSPVPLAIVNGEEDVFINNDFITALPYENLWENTVYRLPGIGHAPFWEVADLFDPYLRRFLTSLNV